MAISSSKQAMYWIGMHMVPNIVGVARFSYGFHRTGSEIGLALDIMLGAESIANIFSDTAVILLLWKMDNAPTTDEDHARMLRVLGAFVVWNTIALLLCCGGNMAGLRYPPKWYTNKDADDLTRTEKGRIVITWAPVIILSSMFKLFYTSLLYDFYYLYKASAIKAKRSAAAESSFSQRMAPGVPSSDAAAPTTSTAVEPSPAGTLKKPGTRRLSAAKDGRAALNSEGNTRMASVRLERKPLPGDVPAAADCTQRNRPARRKSSGNSTVGENTTRTANTTLLPSAKPRRKAQGAPDTSRAASTSKLHKSASRPQELQRHSFAGLTSTLKSSLYAHISRQQSITSTRRQSIDSRSRQSVGSRRRKSVASSAADDSTPFTASQKLPSSSQGKYAIASNTSAPAPLSSGATELQPTDDAATSQVYGSTTSCKPGRLKRQHLVAAVGDKATVVTSDDNASQIYNTGADIPLQPIDRSPQHSGATTEAISPAPPSKDAARRNSTQGIDASDVTYSEVYRKLLSLLRRHSVPTFSAPETAALSRGSARRHSTGAVIGRNVTGRAAGSESSAWRQSIGGRVSEASLSRGSSRGKSSGGSTGRDATGRASVPLRSALRQSIGGRRASEASGSASYRKSAGSSRRQSITFPSAIRPNTPPRPSTRRHPIRGKGGMEVSGSDISPKRPKPSRPLSGAAGSVKAQPSLAEAQRLPAESPDISETSPVKTPTDKAEK